jgi:hypothetical protein
VRRYVSAKHAADCYCYMRGSLEGSKGIDYEKPLVQTTPRAQSPATDYVDDLDMLRTAFAAAKVRLYPDGLQHEGRGFAAICAAVILTAQHCRWEAWCYVRIGDAVALQPMTEREAAAALCVTQSRVRSWLAHVDTLIEQELGDRGCMVKGRVEAGGVEGMYHGDASVRGPKQRARSVRFDVEEDEGD